MALRSDSYSSTSEVRPYIRRILDDATGLNANTEPTVGEVETIIDRISGRLNVAIWKAGIDPSDVRGNSTAKLDCDDYVTAQAVAHIELTRPGEGWGEQEGSRHGAFLGLVEMSAEEFVESRDLAWKRMGLTVADPASQGLAFTAMKKHSERSDPDNTTREQPKFRRGQFDNKDLSTTT